VEVIDAWHSFDTGFKTHQETTPITEWYASSALEGKPRRKIVSTWHKERELAKDPSQPLPDGWSRFEGTIDIPDDCERLFPDGCGSFVYRHHLDTERYYYYPVRLRSIEASTPFCNPPQTRYLFCKTWKSTLLARAEVETRETTIDRLLHLHKEVNQPEIGTMQLHNDEQWCRWFPSEDSHNNNARPSTRQINLVAINRTVEFSNINDEAVDREGLFVVRKEYVTVLWVEWEGVVAYRQACGRVQRKAWESLELEQIDLVLG
jgi:hypothetical protein